MPDNQQKSLFAELTDLESRTVSGGSITSGFSSANSNSEPKNSSSNGVNTLFFVPQPSQLFLYDPIRLRPYKTLVV
jgi:hypothetical protein